MRRASTTLWLPGRRWFEPARRSRERRWTADDGPASDSTGTLAFVVGFPGTIGILALAASLGRSVTTTEHDARIGLVLVAALLLVLGARTGSS